MDVPEWLPKCVAEIYCHMLDENLLSDKVKLFFTDKKLQIFWINAGKYLASQPNQYIENACGTFIGSFINPYNQGYWKSGTAESPTSKNKIRAAQTEADKLFIKARTLSGELANLLEKIEGSIEVVNDTLEMSAGTTKYYPDEMFLMGIVKKFSLETGRPWPEYYERIKTSEGLRVLEDSLKNYPAAGDLFQDVPGLASNKASWKDWAREVNNNISVMVCTYPGDYNMTADDWVNLVQVMVGTVSNNTIKLAFPDFD